MQCGYLLQEGRKPRNKRKRFTPVSIGVYATYISEILLVKSQVHPSYKPPKLDYNPRALPSKNAENSGKCEVCHRQALVMIVRYLRIVSAETHTFTRVLMMPIT